jgi:hypothetical protein
LSLAWLWRSRGINSEATNSRIPTIKRTVKKARDADDLLAIKPRA